MTCAVAAGKRFGVWGRRRQRLGHARERAGPRGRGPVAVSWACPSGRWSTGTCWRRRCPKRAGRGWSPSSETRSRVVVSDNGPQLVEETALPCRRAAGTQSPTQSPPRGAPRGAPRGRVARLARKYAADAEAAAEVLEPPGERGRRGHNVAAAARDWRRRRRARRRRKTVFLRRRRAERLRGAAGPFASAAAAMGAPSTGTTSPRWP